MRQYYLTCRAGSALPGDTGVALVRPEKGSALPSVLGAVEIRSALPSRSRAGIRKSGTRPTTTRAFYEVEAAKKSWSSRELERPIASLLFERLAMMADEHEARLVTPEVDELLERVEFDRRFPALRAELDRAMGAS